MEKNKIITKRKKEMSILLYIDESELSLIFKALRNLRSFETSELSDNLYWKLRLLHGDLEEDSYGPAIDSNYADGDSTTEQPENYDG